MDRQISKLVRRKGVIACRSSTKSSSSENVWCVGRNNSSSSRPAAPLPNSQKFDGDRLFCNDNIRRVEKKEKKMVEGPTSRFTILEP